MSMKQYTAIVTLIVTILFIMSLKMRMPNQAISEQLALERKDQELMEYIRQRNNVSRLLNLRQQLVGQMECEKDTSKRSGTITTGGWCAEFSLEANGHHRTDEALVPALADLFTGKTVASFGDGPGHYKQLILETGKLRSYDAFDGAPFSEKTSDGRVKFLDLTLPQYGLPVYDWIISLEVAEHIPQQYESIYIDNIIRHAKEGVVLSWAVPGQPGQSHVNNRPHEYAKNLMENSGFKLDPADSKKLKEAAQYAWIKSNIYVYRRINTNKEEDIKRLQNA